MLFDDLEIINCTLATANAYFKSIFNSANSLYSAECNRLFEILINSWHKQVDEAHKIRFGV